VTRVLLAQPSAPGKLTVQPGSKLWLHGNSTIHEYSADASELTGTIVVDSMLFGAGNGKLSHPLHKAEIAIPVRKLLSGNEKLDDNMYDALKADDHAIITYQMISDSILSGSGADSLILATNGILAVAGKENVVSMIVTFINRQDGTFGLRGSKEMLMTDFGIDPPSMMFGVLKTDNKIDIHFDLLLKLGKDVSQ